MCPTQKLFPISSVELNGKAPSSGKSIRNFLVKLMQSANFSTVPMHSIHFKIPFQGQQLQAVVEDSWYEKLHRSPFSLFFSRIYTIDLKNVALASPHLSVLELNALAMFIPYCSLGKHIIGCLLYL